MKIYFQFNLSLYIILDASKLIIFSLEHDLVFI